MCAVVLAAMWRSGELRRFRPLTYFLSVKGVGTIVGTFLLTNHLMEAHHKWKAYFYVDWSLVILEAVFCLLTIYSVYQTAMAPMKGLRWLGSVVFRWVAGASFLVALALSIGPHVQTERLIMLVATEFQRTASILTLCLLLFVCFAVKPLGLTYRSRIFGIMVGIGILSTIGLIESSWLLNLKTVYTWISFLQAIAVFSALAIWAVYFIIPEPKRRFILLPTTSPFHKWNEISLALGADPGYVAVGGVGPEAFAPAELEFMRLASVREGESDDHEAKENHSISAA
jgi:hypothetical protein